MRFSTLSDFQIGSLQFFQPNGQVDVRKNWVISTFFNFLQRDNSKEPFCPSTTANNRSLLFFPTGLSKHVRPVIKKIFFRLISISSTTKNHRGFPLAIKVELLPPKAADERGENGAVRSWAFALILLRCRCNGLESDGSCRGQKKPIVVSYPPLFFAVIFARPLSRERLSNKPTFILKVINILEKKGWTRKERDGLISPALLSYPASCRSFALRGAKLKHPNQQVKPPAHPHRLLYESNADSGKREKLLSSRFCST